MKMKKFTTFALAAAFTIGTFGISVPVKAAENSTDYTITIPATLTVEQKGWNATDGIKAKVKSGDTFDSSKKLTVTAASANEWNLKSGENAIAYKMASATEQEKSYADATATTSLEISAEDLNTGNYEAPFGIVVEDYTDKPAGTYQDTVTFTASVEKAKTTKTVTWNASDITNARDSFTKDGITITARMIDDRDKNFMGPGTFTTASGKFTKIEVTAAYVGISGTGWSGSGTTKTWTGDASSSVSYSDDIMDMGRGQLKIVFTIEE